jgi:uncharacterized protein (UPF0332 family)
VKAESAELLRKAQRCLANARTILTAGVSEVAAREAYLASFHAAQAILFERKGTTPKTHSGVHGAFAQLALSEPRLGRHLGRALSRAFLDKQVAGYATDRDIEPSEAEEALRNAEAFVGVIRAVLNDQPAA